jgi:hypothetical protein
MLNFRHCCYSHCLCQVPMPCRVLLSQDSDTPPPGHPPHGTSRMPGVAGDWTRPYAGGIQLDWTKPAKMYRDLSCRSRTPRMRGATDWQVPCYTPATRKSTKRPQPQQPGAWQCTNVDATGNSCNNQQNSTLYLRGDLLAAASGLNSSCDDKTAYAMNGVSRERIQRVLSGERRVCNTKCQQSCPQRLKMSDVAKLCDLYWKLGQEERAYLVSCLKAEAEGSGQTKWALGNHVVCFDAWCALLGSTKRTILKMVAGEVDARRAGWVHNAFLTFKHCMPSHE